MRINGILLTQWSWYMEKRSVRIDLFFLLKMDYKKGIKWEDQRYVPSKLSVCHVEWSSQYPSIKSFYNSKFKTTFHSAQNFEH